MARFLALTVAVSWACATQKPATNALTRSQEQSRLVVGHSESGEVVVSSTHLDAMRGLAIPESEIGVKGPEDVDGTLLCSRQIPTGSHMPRWICRYVHEIDQERLRTQAFLQAAKVSKPINPL